MNSNLSGHMTAVSYREALLLGEGAIRGSITAYKHECRRGPGNWIASTHKLALGQAMLWSNGQ